jgi:hypothetical protein
LGYCWGWGSYGALGDSARLSSSSPRLIYGGNKFVLLSAGESFTCGLTTGRETYCWGTIFSSLSSPIPYPVRLVGGLQFRSISASRSFACGVVDDDSVYCWGGRFGSSPVKLAADISFALLGTASDALVLCGISRTDDTWCWNDGAGSTPIMVTSSAGLKSVSSAGSQSCGIARTSSRAYCWGSVGLLGDGEVPFRLDPRSIIGAIRFRIP